jgi:orotate phosphoribosyltransferase
VSPGERVAVIEDAVTTGHSAHQVVQLVRQHGGDVVAVGALVDRHTGLLPDWPAFLSVLRVENVPSWLPEDCPLCRAGIPLTRPKN